MQYCHPEIEEAAKISETKQLKQATNDELRRELERRGAFVIMWDAKWVQDIAIIAEDEAQSVVNKIKNHWSVQEKPLYWGLASEIADEVVNTQK